MDAKQTQKVIREKGQQLGMKKLAALKEQEKAQNQLERAEDKADVKKIHEASKVKEQADEVVQALKDEIRDTAQHASEADLTVRRTKSSLKVAKDLLKSDIATLDATQTQH